MILKHLKLNLEFLKNLGILFYHFLQNGCFLEMLFLKRNYFWHIC